MRLDKFLADSTPLSRRQARAAVKSERVAVNGEITKDFSQHVEPEAAVTLDNEPVAAPHTRYFMLHKPEGYVCANRDKNNLTVMDLIDEPNKEKLHIAGRLDIDTTGLVLITDDGQWSHRITSPKHGCEKTYHVILEDALIEKAEEKLAKGIMLEGEKKRTQPARLERIDDFEVNLTIQEGKYHQVKRMFAALGNHVEKLHRFKVGPLELDFALQPGEYRELTAEELAAFDEE